MEIAVQLEGTRLGLTLLGSIDRPSIGKLRQYLDDIRAYDSVELDMSGVRFIDTAFINLLVELKNRAASAVRKIRLINTDDNVIEILKLCQVDKLYAIN